MNTGMKRAVKTVALAAAATLLLASCSSEGASSNNSDSNSTGPLKIGSIMPLTGTIEFVSPGPIAAFYQAIDDIDAAGGVLGQPVEVVVQANEGDATDTSIVDKAVAEVAATDVQFLLGPMGSSIGLHSATAIADEEIVSISPSATSAALSGFNPYYFRTVVSDDVQAEVVASLIIQDGNQNVGILVQNDDYGVGLRDKFEATFTAQGGEVVYGGKDKGQEFPMDQSTFASEVSAIMNAKTDAVVIFAFDQTKQIIPELVNQGFDLSKLYLVDVNTADYSDLFDPGTLEGAQGVIPGAQPDPEFLATLSATYKKQMGKELSSTVYMLEAYDAMILGALAAERGGATDSATIQKNLHAVSGSEGGEECATFADCKALLEKGENIVYKGRAGGGPFNDDNDPSSATFGVYAYGADNKPVFRHAVSS